MKPLTPQRKKELLMLAGVGAAALALLYLRAKNGASSTSTTGAVGPLFDPSSLLGSGSGFDPSSGLPLGTDTGTGTGTDLTTAADTIGNDVATAIAQWLAGQPVAAPSGGGDSGAGGAGAAVVTPTTQPPYPYGNDTVTINVVQPSPPQPSGALHGGSDSGGQATRTPTSSVARGNVLPGSTSPVPGKNAVTPAPGGNEVRPNTRLVATQLAQLQTGAVAKHGAVLQ